jgi:DNA-binding MarR family transcriptional regulator
MAPHTKLHLEKFLPYRLSVLSNTVSSAIAAAYFMNFGLSIPEWRVMAVLAANPGLSAAEVTARTAMDKVAVSRAVAALQAAGRLHRTTAPADRRRTHLALTRAGMRVYAQVVPMALEYERHLVAPLSRRDRATLDRLVRILLGRAVELGPAHAE